MRQSGRVFSLLRVEEIEEYVDGEILEFRINELVNALQESGYRIDTFMGNKYKYSILEHKNDGFDEVGIIISDEVYTRDSKNLEDFLESYEF